MGWRWSSTSSTPSVQTPPSKKMLCEVFVLAPTDLVDE
jgi:hypothetical protein